MKRTTTKKPVEAKPETLVKAKPVKPKPVKVAAPKDDLSWPFYWHPWDKVVRSSSTGLVDVNLTNIARKRRGLETPWTPNLLAVEQYQDKVV